jgi:hypothetical protein
MENSLLPPLPTALYDIAFQPIGRGGLVHFTAGNIRIVMKARELVSNGAERDKINADGKEWQGEDWVAFLNDHFGLQEGNDPDEERLLVTGQKVYQCRHCDFKLL